MKFAVNQAVILKQHIWNKPNPPTGRVIDTFNLKTNIFRTERELECSVRDADKCATGYVVLWDHNNLSNPWSEYELEAAE